MGLWRFCTPRCSARWSTPSATAGASRRHSLFLAICPAWPENRGPAEGQNALVSLTVVGPRVHLPAVLDRAVLALFCARSRARFVGGAAGQSHQPLLPASHRGYPSPSGFRGTLGSHGFRKPVFAAG